MKRLSLSGFIIIATLVGLLVVVPRTFDDSSARLSDKLAENTPGIDGRFAYELDRLADPRTGKIPENIRWRELLFAQQLPNARPGRDSFSVDFEAIGPYNCGGRTRAFALDVRQPDVMLAGAVSGGMWRSEDGGDSWQKVSHPQDHQAVSCIVQDVRSGKGDTWYYGSGEWIGNSASKSFTANYTGSGIYKSVDSGISWALLPVTATQPHKVNDWDYTFSMAIDPVRLDSDIVYAAIRKGIQRSNDGGLTWKNVLPSESGTETTEIHVTSDGVAYAAIASNGVENRGFWRSDDGFEWTKITPSTFPQVHDRTLIRSVESNPNILYYFSYTRNSGVNATHLYKYEYISGDGSGAGGNWTDLTENLVKTNFDLQGAYCMVLGVKPDDEDVVFIGGTNLYRSLDGFTDSNTTVRVGGYSIDGDSLYSYFTGGGKHYPDQQNLFFHPNDPNILISTTDGGVHKTSNCTAPVVEWESLNNGYISSQFYAIGIDQETPGSRVVIGGLQDRGTWWTDEADLQTPWTHIRGADGAYSEVSNGGEYYYTSTQYANIERRRVDENGVSSDYWDMMPKQLGRGGSAGWRFVHPFTLDRVNNDVIYLPHQNDLWRNDKATSTDSAEFYSAWRLIATVDGTITAISSSEADEGVVYLGTSAEKVYRIDDAHTTFFTNPNALNATIDDGGDVSNIAIDPTNSDRAILVYSNYNTKSLWFTENGGEVWEPIEGNLRGTTDEGFPDFLYFISDGPSIRWAEIIPRKGGYLYFIGTSVGLFATDELEGDSTVWVQQSPNLIGNVVVDMLHYRSSDGWLAVGTHGNGIYAGTVNFVPDPPAGLDDVGSDPSWNIYPNPTNGQVFISWDEEGSVPTRMTVFNSMGQLMLDEQLVSKTEGPLKIDLQAYPTGLYYISLESNAGKTVKSVLRE